MKPNLLRAASTVSLLTLLSRIAGLGREVVVARFFGASEWTDAFNVAFRLPNLLRRLFAEGAFSQAFVPLLNHSLQNDPPQQSQAFVSATATVLAWALALVCGLGVVGAPLLTWLMASGLSPQSFDAASWMTRLMFPYIGLISLVSFASALLNAKGHFAIPAATPILLNLAMIAAGWGLRGFFAQPIYALALGVMLGGVAQCAWQWWALKRHVFTPTLHWRPAQLRRAWQHEGVHRLLRKMAPALFAVSVAQISLVINTQIASHLGRGSVSWLSYADRLMEFPTALLGVALGVVLLPQLSRAVAAHDMARYSADLDWGLRLMTLLALPASVALLVFARPLIETLFFYGAFDAEDVNRTAQALACYGVGLTGLIAVKLLAPGFYAQQDTRTPARVALVVLVATQLSNVLFVPWLAHAGLALSISVGALINATLLGLGLLRRGLYQPLPGWAAWLARLGVALVPFTLVLWGAARFAWGGLPAWQRVLVTLLVCGVAAAVYFGTLMLAGWRWRELRAPKS